MSYGGPPLGSINQPANYLFPRGIVLDRDLTHRPPVRRGEDRRARRALVVRVLGRRRRRPPSLRRRDAPALHRSRAAVRLPGHRPPVLLAEGTSLRRQGDGGRSAGARAGVLRGRQGLRPQAGRRPPRQAEAPARAALFSTLGRVAARALESQIVASRLEGWLDELRDNMHSGDLRIADEAVWDRDSWPDKARGWGWHEAPRGSLAHWVEIRDGEIANYQAVVPTTWNSGPRDTDGQPGPYELALVGTPVADPKRPLEILRTVHSFDPCMACAVHVLDPRAPDGAAVTRRVARVVVGVASSERSRAPAADPRQRLGSARPGARAARAALDLCLAASGPHRPLDDRRHARGPGRDRLLHPPPVRRPGATRSRRARSPAS